MSFVGRTIHKFEIPRIYYSLSKIAYNLKALKSSVHEHVQCRQTTKLNDFTVLV